MKAMMVSDYLNLRGVLPFLCGISLVIAAFISVATGTAASAAAALAAMLPFMLMFSLAAIDEKGGWERFRLTLPLTRKQVVLGRYAFVGIVMVVALLFAFVVSWALALALPSLPFGDMLDEGSDNVAIIMGAAVGATTIVAVAMAIAQPLMMRYGMTKATRIVPMVLVLAMSGIAVLAGDGVANTDLLQQAIRWLDTGSNYFVLVAGLLLFDALVYALSAFVAVKLYARRAL